MLDVQHLTKKYGKTTACDDVTFHLDPGSVNVILGPNGAGKSTLMKSIIGFLRYSGTVTVKGFSNRTSEARKIIGYIPEMPALYQNLTVSEHMEFVARAYRLTDYKGRIDELLKRFELDDKRKKFGDELSKGMQQKANICLGLLPDPEFVLMDEPMIGLDPHAIKQLKLLMEEMREQGKTLFISTHIIDSVDMLWDRALIMQGGRLVANVTREEFENTDKTLEDIFFEVTEGVSKEDVTSSEND
ncbi:MAG: ABC transporter ATP-binding protein [Clostridia bacterium]|jgi:ABC-type multidrug transport system ATPase subunit|nr:ABC transporter ATP-binding protein [Clostridia bacterium]